MVETTDRHGTEADRIPTIESEKEPEYVGAHSAVTNDECQNWIGKTESQPEQCGADSTHTVVMYSGQLHEISMCNDCGEPEDVTQFKREWSA